MLKYWIICPNIFVVEIIEFIETTTNTNYQKNWLTLFITSHV